MKLSFPHMGNTEILLKDLFRRTGIEVVVPPPTSEKTLKLGVKCATEFACLPLKATIGNFIEALEAGADTLVMAGGVGPCRFGYYAEIQRRILQDLGYQFEMIVLEPPRADWLGFFKTCRRLAPGKSVRQIVKIIKTSFSKARALDFVEKKVLRERAYELVPHSTTKAYKEGIALLDRADTPEEIEEAKNKAFELIDWVEKDLSREPLRVGIVGEFYMLLEPFFNFDMEEWLGRAGVSLERAVYLSDWISVSKENQVTGFSHHQVQEAAEPYLAYFVGGEGQPTIGNSVHYARAGFDGAIQLFPFTCMPDTIAKSILPKLSKDLDFPVISFVIDEQTGKAGVITRLEAFLDLLEAKRKSKKRRGEGAELRELSVQGLRLGAQ